MTFMTFVVLGRLFLLKLVALCCLSVMMFVAYDVFECVAYRVCHSAKNHGRNSRDTVPLILIVSSTIFEHVFASAYCIYEYV